MFVLLWFYLAGGRSHPLVLRVYYWLYMLRNHSCGIGDPIQCCVSSPGSVFPLCYHFSYFCGLLKIRATGGMGKSWSSFSLSLVEQPQFKLGGLAKIPEEYSPCTSSSHFSNMPMTISENSTFHCSPLPPDSNPGGWESGTFKTPVASVFSL